MHPVIPIFSRGFRFVINARRPIHSSSGVSKSVKAKILEVADKVNKKVGRGLANAIETGEKATEKTKETLEATTKRTNDKVRGVKDKVDAVEQESKKAGKK